LNLKTRPAAPIEEGKPSEISSKFFSRINDKRVNSNYRLDLPYLQYPCPFSSQLPYNETEFKSAKKIDLRQTYPILSSCDTKAKDFHRMLNSLTSSSSSSIIISQLTVTGNITYITSKSVNILIQDTQLMRSPTNLRSQKILLLGSIHPFNLKLTNMKVLRKKNLGEQNHHG
jgi:hypothetical protein